MLRTLEDFFDLTILGLGGNDPIIGPTWCERAGIIMLDAQNITYDAAGVGTGDTGAGAKVTDHITGVTSASFAAEKTSPNLSSAVSQRSIASASRKHSMARS